MTENHGRAPAVASWVGRRWGRAREWIARGVTWGCASVSLLALGLITVYLFCEGVPVFRTVDPLAFLGGKAWFPTSEPPSLGILPMILGSGLVTMVALAVAVPFGVATALFIGEVVPTVFRNPLKVAVELLAGIPSVVYGFFGLVIVVPWLEALLGLPTGQTALTAALLLGVMALPTVASLTEDAVAAVPNAWREAAFALGATHWQTMRTVVVPAARSGLLAGVLLGMGRAVGETMTVLMVSGNSPRFLPSLTSPTRTLTATIALEMAETPVGSPHYHALFAVGTVLFVFTLLLNVVGDMVGHRLGRHG
ncbi:phosphate ABC transporter permease subunit PstC [Candidatus Bipolaricaulota bacterium]|nr:phosphate ABC transporter permease subunit PstC [Candidatus Bipolaricaulota bacterium]